MSLVVRRYKGQGRGVYSTRPIRKGAVVEVSPVVVIGEAEWKPMLETILERYAFEWGRTGRDRALPLAFGALFNHSEDPNLDFRMGRNKDSIEFYARRDIPARQQLTVDYGWDDDFKKQWLNGR